MIRNNKLLLVAGANALSLSLYAGAASAVTFDATATANVLRTLVINEDTQMSFGDVLAGTGGTVVLSHVDSSRLPTGAEIVASGGGAAGQFTVEGTTSKSYTLTLPTTDQTLTHSGGGATMTVNAFTNSLCAGTSCIGTLSADAIGIDTFSVGATLNISAGQLAGTYTGTYPITVDYQ